MSDAGKEELERARVRPVPGKGRRHNGLLGGQWTSSLVLEPHSATARLRGGHGLRVADSG